MNAKGTMGRALLLAAGLAAMPAAVLAQPLAGWAPMAEGSRAALAGEMAPVSGPGHDYGGSPTAPMSEAPGYGSNPCNPCEPTNPCNPCAPANPCNPCEPTNPCNPCEPTNPCNPCAPANPCNPCGTVSTAAVVAKNPCNPCSAKGGPSASMTVPIAVGAVAALLAFKSLSKG